MERLQSLDAVLLGTGFVVMVVLSLTESWGQLCAAVVAYAAGWWLLGVEAPGPVEPVRPEDLR